MKPETKSYLKTCLKMLAAGTLAGLVSYVVAVFPRADTPEKLDKAFKPWTGKGDVVSVSRVELVDDKGDTIVVLTAGPPPVIEIKMKNGSVKKLDLQRLAGSPFLGEVPKAGIKEE